MTEPKPLSEREKEVLRLVTEGLTNREISQRLSISANTVKVHMRNIFEKTGVASRTEATVYAIEQRIVDVPGGEEAPAAIQQSPRRFRWVWGMLLLVLLVLLIITFTDVFTPSTETESQAIPDPAERWKELAPMPEPRVGMAAVAYDNQIYAIAGEGPEGVSGSVFRYIIEKDAWDRLSDKPVPVTDVTGALIGEKIYIPGGRLADGQPTDLLEIYDPRRNTWEVGAPMPEALSAYALADYEGLLYLFGGWDGETAVASVMIYDPIEDVWQPGTPMTVSRMAASAMALNSGIVVLGGWDRETAFDLVSVYYPTRDIQGESPWGDFPDLPNSCFNFGSTVVSDMIFLLGGQKFEEGRAVNCGGIQYRPDGWHPWNTGFVGEFNDPHLILQTSDLYVLHTPEDGVSTELIRTREVFYEIYIPIIK